MIAPKLHSIVPEKCNGKGSNNNKLDAAVERAQKFRDRAKFERNKYSVSITEKQCPNYSKAFKILEDKIELSLFIYEQELFDDKCTITEQYDDLRSASQHDIETPRIGIDSNISF